MFVYGYAVRVLFSTNVNVSFFFFFIFKNINEEGCIVQIVLALIWLGAVVITLYINPIQDGNFGSAP